MQDFIPIMRLALDTVVLVVGLYLFIEKLFPVIREYRIVQFIDRTILAAKRMMQYASDNKLLESEIAIIEQWLQRNGYDMDTGEIKDIIAAEVARLKDTLKYYDPPENASDSTENS